MGQKAVPFEIKYLIAAVYKKTKTQPKAHEVGALSF